MTYLISSASLTPGRLARIAALAAIAVAIVALIAFTQSTRGQEPASEFDSSTVLLLSSRDRLVLCIDGVSEQQGRSLVQDSLAKAAVHDQWSAAGLAVNEPRIDVGCPTQPYLVRSGVSSITQAGKTAGNLRELASSGVSEYRLYIFALDRSEMDKVFSEDGVTVGFAPQEALCEGGVCSEVSTGLYVSTDVIGDTDRVAKVIQQGLGLEPRFNEPTPDEEPSR